MVSVQKWLDTRYEQAMTAGRHRVLSSVLGPVRVIDDHEKAPPLAWPARAVKLDRSTPSIATVVITRQQAPTAISRLLTAPETRINTQHGRGAFPARWLPGQPWIAQYRHGPTVVRDGSRILVSARHDPGAWANRILREVFIHHGRHHGFRLCHAAVITNDNAGVLITGNSGAGKTDLALRLARLTHARVVTVDRGIMSLSEPGIRVGMLPFGLNIHHGTLSDLGYAEDSLLQRYPPSQSKHYLSVEDAERYCKLTLTSWGRATGVVHLTPLDHHAHDWHPLDERGVVGALGIADSADTDPGYQTDWLGLGVTAPRTYQDLHPEIGWALRYQPCHPLPPGWIQEMRTFLTE